MSVVEGLDVDAPHREIVKLWKGRVLDLLGKVGGDVMRRREL